MLRTRLLSVGKLLTLVLFGFIVVASVVYLVHHFKKPRGGPEGSQLQSDIVGIFHNTTYKHESNGHIRFVLTAGTDTSYRNGTHELETVRLESNGVDGTRHDVVTADHGKVINTSDLDKLEAEFKSNVKVETSDGLVLTTEYLKFDQATNTVSTPELVRFERKNVEGRSTGMMIEAAIERVHLLKDVTATVKPEQPEPAADSKGKGSGPGKSDAGKSSTAKSGVPKSGAPKSGKGKSGGEKLAKASAPAAPAAHRGASLASNKMKAPTTISGNSALLEKREHRVSFTGNVVITQGSDEMRSDNMVGYLDASNHIERIEARGNSSMKHADVAEVTAPNMDFFIEDGKRLDHAVGSGGVYARSLSADPLREANADSAVITFVEGDQGNLVDTLTADGNAVVHMHAPAPKDERANPTDREIKGDHLALKFFPDGKNLKTAEAQGNAILNITPTKAIRGADKKSMHAPRMTADFFEDGNRVKAVNSEGGVKLELEALVPGKHPLRVTTSRTFTATFLPDSQDIEKAVQEGNFTYNEGDRNATADRAIYDGPSDFLSLRGKRPTGWDEKSRIQADEIDYDNRNNESHARGDVRSTYYDPGPAGNGTPFKKKNSPVLISADRADERNDDSVIIYKGNAHGWQDDNFVKADVIELYQDPKHMVAVGGVQTGLYTIERETSPGKKEVVPVFATSDRMTYSDEDRLVHYEGNVKAKQGTDRIDSSLADIYLKQDSNDLDHLFAKGNVDLIQTGRHGTGDTLTYTADDGRGVLVGRSARIDDAEKGSVMGAELTFYSHDDKVLVENQHGTGRVRSIHNGAKGKEKP
jgi:lipopolysaccharide transport protein LptA/LPS export ABC transporter protein LptC